ncbi:MAG: hypothetical protein OXE59_07725 [Bacteroidetes bacterium]|nr:hypothetical protein [Bacteroidota bacterium]
MKYSIDFRRPNKSNGSYQIANLQDLFYGLDHVEAPNPIDAMIKILGYLGIEFHDGYKPVSATDSDTFDLSVLDVSNGHPRNAIPSMGFKESNWKPLCVYMNWDGDLPSHWGSSIPMNQLNSKGRLCYDLFSF